jgi:FixJ family two-component response regulator
MRPQRILIVEDSRFIAEHIALLVEQSGYKAVGPAHCLQEAQALVDNDPLGIDCVILDMHLEGTTETLVYRLGRAGIRFCFVTGYAAAIPAIFADCPVCAKPFSGEELLATVSASLASSPSWVMGAAA